MATAWCVIPLADVAIGPWSANSGRGWCDSTSGSCCGDPRDAACAAALLASTLQLQVATTATALTAPAWSQHEPEEPCTPRALSPTTTTTVDRVLQLLAAPAPATAVAAAASTPQHKPPRQPAAGQRPPNAPRRRTATAAFVPAQSCGTCGALRLC
jgi:hypothetical protein